MFGHCIWNAIINEFIRTADWATMGKMKEVICLTEHISYTVCYTLIRVLSKQTSQQKRSDKNHSTGLAQHQIEDKKVSEVTSVF